jgi:hypothetical protein
MDLLGAYNSAKGMYGQAETGANIGRDIVSAGKSVWNWLGLKEGGVVAPQSAAFSVAGPKYSLMPIKDRVVLMKEGGVVTDFKLKNYPVNRDPLTFVRQNGLMNKF